MKLKTNQAPRLYPKHQKRAFTLSNIGLMLLSGSLILLVTLLILLKRTHSRKKMITRINAHCQKLGLTPEATRTIIAQAAHETGNFKSAVFLNANNMFGIRDHKRKIKGRLNTLYNGYSSYSNPENSIDDLIDLCRRRRTIFALENIVEYARLLKVTDYYEADEKEYREGMIAWYKHYFPESAHKYA